jgi:Cu-processing system ATP-binding protein
VIEFKNIEKKFGQLEVLKGINFEVNKGMVTAVLGPNGSGKTTLIKSLLGMVYPDGGAIVIDGYQLNGKADYRNKIGFLPQIARFPENLTTLELLRMVGSVRREESRHEDLLERFKLEPFLDKKLAHLSGGTRQKINLVLALMFDTDYLILDEPTTGLDPRALQSLKKIIGEKKQEGKTILVSSHILSFVEEVCDEIVFLLEGQIHYQGTISELKIRTNSHDLEDAIAQLMEDKDV